MINFNWDISDIDVVDINSQSNVIRSFNWTVTAEMENHTASYSSSYSSSEGLESAEVNNFTEFTDLTKDVCTSWVETSLGLELDDIKEKLRLAVKAKIAESNKNIVDSPWD